MEIDGNFHHERIRLSIFSITGVCVGFPALLWALRVLYHHHKPGGQISLIAISLLYSDLLELILIPVIVTYIFKEDPEPSPVLTVTCLVLFGTRLCGHMLHPLVALESILTYKCPSLAFIFSARCSISLCILVMGVAIGCQLIQSNIFLGINVCLFVLPVLVHALTCILICKASPDTNQATNREPEMLLLSVDMFTLSVFYAPFFLNCFLPVPLVLDPLVSMRLISEPLLCVLTCRNDHLFAAQ